MSMLEYKGYHATMEYDAESDTLFGKVYGLNDSLNFEGKTLDEFKEMFRLRISPELHRKAAAAAAAKNVSLNQYVAYAVDHAVSADGL